VKTEPLTQEDAAVFDTFVVPKYLSLYGERVVAMLAVAEEARVCHLACRTGYPDKAVYDQLPNAHVFGRDPSTPAIELARAKALALPSGRAFDYAVGDVPLALPTGAFSHAFVLHPRADERASVLRELARLVAPFGQALLAMPLRGSFTELADLLAECALKHDLPELEQAVAAAVQERPTDAIIESELQAAGFEYIDVDIRHRSLKFGSGRAFFEDPVARLLVLPEVVIPASVAAKVDAFAYVRDAIDKYWSEGSFELTVSVGVVSGRRR
jgi:SAM-dependent methyltransferase